MHILRGDGKMKKILTSSLFLLQAVAWTFVASHYATKAFSGWIQNEDIKSSTEIQSATLSTMGNTTSGSNQLTSLVSTANIGAGQYVYGTGIPASTTVSSISGNVVTLSANATATGTGITVTFGGQLSQLPNDTKIFITANGLNETLAQAISNGDISGAGTVSVTTQSSAYSMSNSDRVVLVNAASGTVPITLPAASAVANKILYIKKIDTTQNAVTFVGTIDGNTSYQLSNPNDSASIISNGTTFYTL